jgi:hypothetical protein
MVTIPLKGVPSALYNTSWMVVSGGCALTAETSSSIAGSIRENVIGKTGPPADYSVVAGFREAAVPQGLFSSKPLRKGVFTKILTSRD